MNIGTGRSAADRAASSATAVANCPACGTPAVPAARFCFACGASLTNAAPYASPSVAPSAAARAERRVVTVLFGDLTDFTAWAEDLDPERVGVVADRVLAALAGAVVDVGGHVDKLTGDGIMAVFGAPTAHEDDPERAVRAAVRMQEAVRRLVADETGGGRRLGLRVGLNTGEVLAGLQAALAYTVVGDTVNTASRLSDAAGVGAVWAGRQTMAATRSVAGWRALPPLRLKGKRDPVPAYELIGLRPAGAGRVGLGEEAPLLGRDAELGWLIGRMMDVVNRAEPASAVVVGEAGIGKTRLAQELGRFLGELPDARVLWGRCRPYGEGHELAPIVEMVRTACGVPAETADAGIDESAAADRVRRAVARLSHSQPPAGGRPVTERLLGLLGLIETSPPLPREGPTPGSTAPFDPVVDAVVWLFQQLAHQGPLLLVVDDIQWGSSPMLDAVNRIARGLTGPVLFVAVGRRELLERRPDNWRALPAPELLTVTALDEPAADALLRAYLGGGSMPADARAALLGRAQGNPFFLAELLHLLIDRGLLVEQPAGYSLIGPLPAELLPAGVQAVLAARIDGLDPSAKATLRDAAVLGTRFRPEALPALMVQRRGQSVDGEAVDGEDVRAALARLVERQLIQPLSGGGCTFRHTLARDVAYAGIPKVQRAYLHAAAARWALSAPLGLLDNDDAFVAAQAEQAVLLAVEMRLPPTDPVWEARGVAFGALARAGQQALGRDDDRAAEDLLGRALRLGADRGSSEPAPAELLLGVRVGYAAALAGRRQLDAASAALHAEPSPLTAVEPAVRARALVVLGDLRRAAGSETGAAEAYVAALAAAREAGLDGLAGNALRELGQLDYVAGRLRAAERRYREALELADRADDPRGAGWSLQHLAWSATTRGDYPTADAALSRAVGVFAALTDAGGLAWCTATEALVRLFAGRLSRARDLASGLIADSGDQWARDVALFIDAVAAAELGEVGSALRAADLALAGFRASTDQWGESLALTAQGVGYRAAGEPERAVTVLRSAAGLAEAHRHPHARGLALMILGYAHLDRRDLDPANAAAAAALDLLGRLEVEAHAYTGALVLQAQVWRARGELTAALAVFDKVTGCEHAPSLLFPRRQALAHHAGTLLAAGRPEQALATARRAVEVPAEDVRSRVVALRALGAALAATGDAEGARRVLTDALAVARSTEQRSEVPATERALAAV